MLIIIITYNMLYNSIYVYIYIYIYIHLELPYLNILSEHNY